MGDAFARFSELEIDLVLSAAVPAGRQALATASRPLVENSFTVPDSFVADGFRFELLGPQRNAADHAAWTSSIEHIRSTPGLIVAGRPRPG